MIEEARKTKKQAYVFIDEAQRFMDPGMVKLMAVSRGRTGIILAHHSEEQLDSGPEKLSERVEKLAHMTIRFSLTSREIDKVSKLSGEHREHLVQTSRQESLGKAKNWGTTTTEGTARGSSSIHTSGESVSDTDGSKGCSSTVGSSVAESQSNSHQVSQSASSANGGSESKQEGSSEGMSQMIRPRFTAETALYVNSEPGLAVVHAQDDPSIRGARLVRMLYAYEPDEYLARRSAGFPARVAPKGGLSQSEPGPGTSADERRERLRKFGEAL